MDIKQLNEKLAKTLNEKDDYTFKLPWSGKGNGRGGTYMDDMDDPHIKLYYSTDEDGKIDAISLAFENIEDGYDFYKIDGILEFCHEISLFEDAVKDMKEW